MPTPSETQRHSDFGVGNSPPRRSVFANYPSAPTGAPAAAAQAGALPGGEPAGDAWPGEAAVAGGKGAAIDVALARAFLHRFLARAFEAPDRDGWNWLQSTAAALRSAAGTLASTPSAPFMSAAETLIDRLSADGFDAFHLRFVICFGHTVRGDCPVNEIEYGDLKADPLFQPHRLADLGAFYEAFGLELTPDAAERHDHISIELEFMSVLAAKEAYALTHELGDLLTIVRDAQKQFMREHLGRWTPAFARRLERLAGDSALGALACFTREFLEAECARFGVRAGSEALVLRPIDEAAESLCASCGLP